MHGAIALGSPATLDRWRASRAVERPQLAQALAATIGSEQQVVIVPNEDQRRVAEQIALPQLLSPESGPLARAMSWASLGLDWPPHPRVKVVIEASDPAAAQQLRTAIGSIFDRLEKRPELQNRAAAFAEFRKQLDWKITGPTLSVELANREGKLSAFARRDSTDARSGGAGQSTKRRGRPVENSRPCHAQLPRRAQVATGSRNHGPTRQAAVELCVAILPYLDEQSLYEQFHLDEPWDSEHNKALIAKMPQVYQCPNSKVGQTGCTVYLAPRGPSTMFPGPSSIRIRDVTDGISNTIMLVEADDEHAVPWTKPEDWTLDPEHPTAGLGGHFPGLIQFSFGDGHVTTMRDTIGKEELLKFFTRNGNEDHKSSEH